MRCSTNGRYSPGGTSADTSKGESRIPDCLKPNSLCLLTEKPEAANEAGRRIIGVFMVGDDFFGCDCRDGIVHAHPAHRLELSPERQMPFWPYITREPAGQRWGRTALKYCSNKTKEKILFDLLTALQKTELAETAEGLYQYYCGLSRLPARQLLNICEILE